MFSSCRAALLPVVLVLAACQPLPRPFAEDARPLSQTHPLNTLQGSAGVVVQPIARAPAQLADAAVEALIAADIPASKSGGNRASLGLAAEVTAAERDDGGVDLLIVWNLSDGAGRVLVSHRKSVRAASAAWRGGDKALMETLARDAVAGLESGLRPAAAPPPRIAVVSVGGAPGDGNAALANEMRRALANTGAAIEVTADAAAATHRITGEVRVRPVGPEDEVSVTWVVRDGKGRELGRLDQRNMVGRGTLSPSWGAVARAVAEAAADGLLTLLAQVKS